MAPAAAHPMDNNSDDDASSWTTVRATGRRRRHHGHLQQPRKPPACSAGPAPGPASPPRSVASIAAEYRAVRAAFELTPCCATLRALATRIASSGSAEPGGTAAPPRQNRHGRRRLVSPPVRKAVCLGIGTFDPPDAGWEAKSRTFLQLVAFLILVEELESVLGTRIPCLFQEPLFSRSDAAFLTSCLGHTVVHHPAACRAVDAHTLLYGVHLYRPVYALALARGRTAADAALPTPARGCVDGDGDDLPAVFIGTGWPVWDAVTLSGGNDDDDDDDDDDDNDAAGGQEALMARLRRIEDEYECVPFPQEEQRGTAFSSTGVYWRRGRLPDRSDDDDIKDSSECDAEKPPSGCEQEQHVGERRLTGGLEDARIA